MKTELNMDVRCSLENDLNSRINRVKEIEADIRMLIGDLNREHAYIRMIEEKLVK